MKLKIVAAVGAAALLARCGSTPENVDVFNDSARDNFYETMFGTESEDNVYWSQVAAYFGFSAAADAKLSSIGAALATPPALYTAGSTPDDKLDDAGKALKAKYGELKTAVAADAIGAGIQAQCGKVVGMTTGAYNAATNGAKAPNDEGTDTIDIPATVRVFKYKLRNADGTVEDKVRTALVTVPNAKPTNGAPVLFYGHASVNGLSYGEIIKLFGKLQVNMVIAAPTFPGERLCSPDTDTSAGTCTDAKTLAAPIEAQTGSHIWDDDATEMIGLANCLNEAYLTAKAGAAATPPTTPISGLSPTTLAVEGSFDFKAEIGDKVKTAKVTTASGVLEIPYQIFGGADRGALTAQIAVARAGVMLKDLAAGAESAIVGVVGATAAAPFPNALVNIGGNYSTTMGLNRVALHSMITSNIRFDKSPGWAVLRNTTFADFRTATGDDVTDGQLSDAKMKELAVEIAKRDMVMMEQFNAVSLRNWTAANDIDPATAKGSAIVLHGTQNAVVGYGQAKIAQAVRNNVQNGVAAQNATAASDATKVPGYYHAVYAFQDPTADNWYNCKTTAPTTAKLITACAEGLDRSGMAEADWDGWIYVGINTNTDDEITDNYNHVGDASFLAGALASISAADAAIVADATAGSDFYQNFVTTCAAVLPSPLGGAALYMGVELFNEKSAEVEAEVKVNAEAAYPGGYNEAAIPTLTPAAIAGSFLTYHSACIAPQS